MGFTFVNTTGMPALSQSAAKRMRAHITKTNFAKRRERFAGKGPSSWQSPEEAFVRRRGDVPTIKTQEGANRSVSDEIPSEITDSESYTKLLCRILSLFFLDGTEYPRNREEQIWIELLASETALVESSMAIGTRFWSPNMSYQIMAQSHSSLAIQDLIQRIDTGLYSDAVIGAVLTMAFGSRLADDVSAWNMHVDGVAVLLKERQTQGCYELPFWFKDLFIIDSTNAALGFPRMYHDKIIDAAGIYTYQPLLQVAQMSKDLTKLLEMIENHRISDTYSKSTAKEIQENWDAILAQTQSLQGNENPSVQATAFSTQIIISLSWPPPQAVNLTYVATRLKEALCQVRIQPCVYMDLTSCQLMLGAIGASEGTATRTWFTKRLQRAAGVLRSRGCNVPLSSPEKGFMIDSDIVRRIKTLLRSLDG